MEAPVNYNIRSLLFDGAYWWYYFKDSSFCSWVCRKFNFSCESWVLDLEDQGKSLAFLDKLYSNTSSLLTCCWNTLEKRFTSTLTANILYLKLELQNLKKGNDSINSFSHKIKVARDKLFAVGVIVDNEELLCIVLKGLTREYAHFCSTIWTRSDPISMSNLLSCSKVRSKQWLITQI